MRIKKNTKKKIFYIFFLFFFITAPGENATVFSFVRHALATRCKILSIRNGFEGLLADFVEDLEWKSVYGWSTLGGSMLGTQRVEAKHVGYEKIAIKLKKYKIDGLLIIGGITNFFVVDQPEPKFPLTSLSQHFLTFV